MGVVLLVRHGQASWGAADYDNLSEVGEQQSRVLGRALADRGVQPSVVVAGAGDGEVPETVRALREDGFDGFFSLEPHLGTQNALGGFSGADLWIQAHAAFTDILRTEGIAYA